MLENTQKVFRDMLHSVENYYMRLLFLMHVFFFYEFECVYQEQNLRVHRMMQVLRTAIFQMCMNTLK